MHRMGWDAMGCQAFVMQRACAMCLAVKSCDVMRCGCYVEIWEMMRWEQTITANILKTSNLIPCGGNLGFKSPSN